MIKNDPHKPRLIYSNVVRWRQQLFLYVRSSNPLFSGLLFIVLALFWSFLLFLRLSYAAWSEPAAAANKAYVDANSGGGGNTLIIWGSLQCVSNYSPGQGAPTCSTGYTIAYAGYGPYIQAGNGTADILGIVADNCGNSTSEWQAYTGSVNRYYAVASNGPSCDYVNTCNVCVK